MAAVLNLLLPKELEEGVEERELEAVDNEKDDLEIQKHD